MDHMNRYRKAGIWFAEAPRQKRNFVLIVGAFVALALLVVVVLVTLAILGITPWDGGNGHGDDVNIGLLVAFIG